MDQTNLVRSFYMSKWKSRASEVIMFACAQIQGEQHNTQLPHCRNNEVTPK